MSSEVVIIGAGGHGKVIADIITSVGDTVLGFLDDSQTQGTTIAGHKVLGGVADFKEYSTAKFVIAIGNNAVRKRVAQELKGVQWYTAIHQSAVISPLATVGEGTVVLPFAVINSCSTIGEHAIINTGAVVEHDNLIGPFTHLSPNATCCGGVSVGESCHIGAGAVVINCINVCSNVVVGAGGVVVRDITEPGTYIGTPAKLKA